MTKEKETLTFNKAKNDFERAIKNATEEEIALVKNSCFGILAMKFAMKYVNPKDSQKLYTRIYNIYFDYFNNLDVN